MRRIVRPPRTHVGLVVAVLLGLHSFPGTLRGADTPRGLASSWANADRGIPLIRSFEVPPTRHNGEVWAFAKGPDGQLWIGSDELFLFNGDARERISLPFSTYAVRALAHDDKGRLWVGAIGEIGHLERTSTGAWSYVSADAQLRAAGIGALRDVWLAHSTPQGVVFVADTQVIRWDGSRFEHWTLPSRPTLLSNEDGKTLWIFESGTGLLRMTPNGPALAIALKDLPSSIVFWALTPGADDGHALLIGTPDGIFLGKAGAWRRLDRVSATLEGKLPLHALMIGPETFAIGSYLGGMLVGTTSGDVLALVNRANGLPSDTVTGLFRADADSLWIGYPGGMARMEARGVASVFDGHNGANENPILKTATHDGRIFVLSRRALSVLHPGRSGSPAILHPATPIPAPFSDMADTPTDFWLSGFGGGVWRIDHGKAQQESVVDGFVFALLPGGHNGDTMYVLENTHVQALYRTALGRWTPRDASIDFKAYPISVVRGAKGDIWISTVTRGLFRFRPVKKAAPGAPTLALVRRYQGGSGLPRDIDRPGLTTVGGRVYVISEQGILGYAQRVDAFVPVPGLTDFSALAATPTDNPSRSYWIVRRTSGDVSDSAPPVLLRLTAHDADAPPTWTAMRAPGIGQIGRITAINYTSIGKPALWIAGSRSLVRLSADALAKLSPPPSLALDRVVRNEASIPLPAAGKPLQLDSDTRQLRFDLAGGARADDPSLRVQSMLSGLSDEWSAPQAVDTFAYTGLRAGRYTFRARTVDSVGRTGPVLTFGFNLEAPWYERAPAVVAYALLGALVIAAGVRWRIRHLKRVNQRLNALVDERTHELAHANAVRNEFLENISHEIRNPLNGIANLVDLLRDANLSPDARRLAHSLVRSTEHLKQVFGDVLGYTKLEYGQVGLDNRPFSLRLLLEDLIALFSVQVHEAGSSLELVYAVAEVDGFRGDSEKIRAILSNFVTNALKYAPATHIVLAVRCSAGTEDGTVDVKIGVRDQGPGIPLEEQARLFKKFSRGLSAKLRGIGGTGLGLAMCRSLAQLMDGEVGVTSSPGAGSTFWLKVPLQRTALPPHPEKGTPLPLDLADNARALIVDDQDYNQAVLRGIAHRLGFATDVAAHAGEVRLLVEQHAYAVVFLDWELPGPNGGEIARELRTHDHTRTAILIATTAHESDEIRQNCLEAGIDGFAPKPFDTAGIRAVLASAAATRRTHYAESAAPRVSWSAMSPDARPGLTLSAFADFAEGDPARARQAVQLYLDTLDQEVQALKVAIESGDAEVIARRAHRLRSHAGLVNATGLNVAAQDLVVSARGPVQGDWTRHTERVFEEVRALKDAVTALRSRPPSDG